MMYWEVERMGNQKIRKSSIEPDPCDSPLRQALPSAAKHCCSCAVCPSRSVAGPERLAGPTLSASGSDDASPGSRARIGWHGLRVSVVAGEHSWRCSLASAWSGEARAETVSLSAPCREPSPPSHARLQCLCQRTRTRPSSTPPSARECRRRSR